MPSNPVRLSTEQEIIEPTLRAEPLRVAEFEDPESYAVFDRLRVLMNQRAFLLKVMAYGLALATLAALLIPFRYEARTQIMPPDSGVGSGLASLLAMTGQSGSGLGMLAGDVLGFKTSGSLFIGILRSRTVEDRIIEKFNLKSVYRARRMQDARRQLEESTQISEDHKSGIITLNVTDHSPARAAAIAQSYVVELDRLVVELNTSAAHRERVFLEDRLKTVKQDLDSSSKEFSEFSSKNTAIDIKEQGKAMMEAAASLQGHLIAAQSEMEGLRQIYTANNVRVRAVQARIDELQKKLEQMGSGDLGPTAAISGNDSLYPSIRKLPLLAVTYSDLYRKTKIQETLFEVLTQQCEMAKVQEAKETPSVKILDEPIVPEKKSFPPRLLIMALGMLFALTLGTIWVLAQANWQRLGPQHPAKLFAKESYTRLKGDLRIASRNGTRLLRVRDKISWFKHATK